MIFSIAIKRESIGADSDPFKNVELKAEKQPAIPFWKGIMPDDSIVPA